MTSNLTNVSGFLFFFLNIKLKLCSVDKKCGLEAVGV